MGSTPSSTRAIIQQEHPADFFRAAGSVQAVDELDRVLERLARHALAVVEQCFTRWGLRQLQSCS